MKTLVISTNNSGETLTINEYPSIRNARENGINIYDAKKTFLPKMVKAYQVTLWKDNERIAHYPLSDKLYYCVCLFYDEEICSLDWE